MQIQNFKTGFLWFTEVKFSSVDVVVPPPPLGWGCFPSSPLRVGLLGLLLLLVVLPSSPSFGWCCFSLRLLSLSPPLRVGNFYFYSVTYINNRRDAVSSIFLKIVSNIFQLVVNILKCYQYVLQKNQPKSENKGTQHKKIRDCRLYPISSNS